MKKIGGFLLILILFTIGLFFINPFAFQFRNWRTQTIIYRSRSNPKDRIEFQMNDLGAFGYNRRIVRVIDGWAWDQVLEIDTNKINKLNWTRVDEDVNELGLKGG